MTDMEPMNTPDDGNATQPNPVRIALQSVLDASRAHDGGEVATYIPELAREDPEQLGVAIASMRGAVHAVGDSDAEFTIQSISKPFVFALALESRGLTDVRRHVGVEPSGEPFNAISVDEDSGRPFNPMINVGAIVTTSLAPGDTADEKFAHLRAGLNAFAGHELALDEAVYESESLTGDRNRALAYLAKSAGTLASLADVATDTYFRQCALWVTARDLAVMAATLATGGVNPLTGVRVVSENVARWTTAVMTGCGMYDASGEWLLQVGLPAKSGVGGGIVALQPEGFGIGTFSPRLDARGNSVRGVAMLEDLSQRHGLHMLGLRGTKLSPVGKVIAEGPGGTDTRAHLRGDLRFGGVEEVMARLRPEMESDGCVTLDFTDVTRVARPARQLMQWASDAAGETDTGQPKLVLHDPEGVLTS